MWALTGDLIQIDLCSWPCWVIVLVFMLAGGVGHYVVRREQHARVRRMRAVAAQFHLPFNDLRGWEKPKFPPFEKGIRTYTLNTFCGPFHGRDIQMGDFHFEVPKQGSDDNQGSTHYYFSYCYIKIPEALFVDLIIRPEGALDKVRAAAGFADINFESHQFSKQYYVQSLDRKFAYDLITPQMMEYLLERSGYTVHLNHAGLLVTRGRLDRTWAPEEFVPAAQFAVNVLRRIPTHVWDAYKAAGGPHPRDPLAGGRMGP